MKKLFGTDGMRGVAGEFPLDVATLHTAGRALAEHFNKAGSRAPQFITGRDTRESGAWLEAAFADGARAAGANIESAGVMTTPGIAFLTADKQADAGIVISASHNPFQDNGIKIFTASGRKLDDGVERQIEQAIYDARDNAKVDLPRESQGTDANQDLQNRYVRYLTDVAGDLRLDDLSIVADCANGAAYAIAPRVLQSLGARNLHVINAAPDGRNINENCGSLHLEHLQAKVKEEQADFGVAFDGDADRALFVDEQGNIVDGDATLWILANSMKARGRLSNNCVVATVMSNLGLEHALAKQEIKLIRASVGDKYVLEKLLAHNLSLGGEQSGHIILPGESLVGDGIRTALHILRAMNSSHEKLSTLAAGFTPFPQILLNVHVREKTPFDEVPAIKTAARQIENELGADGRLLLRYSGTENLARVMIEGKNNNQIERAARHLADIIKSEIGK